MTRIRLHPPEAAGHTVRFRWEVHPPTSLYRNSEFVLQFPAELDVSRLPTTLWWYVALICLHSHWGLLRPCRVELPVGLAPAEVEFWNRLLDSEVVTLEAYQGRDYPRREIQIAVDGPPLAPLPALPDSGRCATAFSGGKDSLLQTGLLGDLSREPVLVTTTSPMPPLEDHLTPRRRYVLSEIAARRDVTLVEVHSDFRRTWDNEFARRLGYPLSVNEVTDTFLYFAVLLAAGIALGVTHLFLASEAEVQENVELSGRTVQHRHFMYSAVTQQAFQGLLANAGIRYCSLTSPLYSFQVQELLWRRYADLRDLQYSCWRVKIDEAACSRCEQCLRTAFCTLALGHPPAQLGVNVAKLLWTMRDWVPPTLPDGGRPVLPTDLVRWRLQSQTVRYLKTTPPGRVVAAVLGGRPIRLLDPDTWAALGGYARLRRRMARCEAVKPPGYRAGFLRLVDPLLRRPVTRIFDEHFRRQEEPAYVGILGRSEALARWILLPLGDSAAADPGTEAEIGTGHR